MSFTVTGNQTGSDPIGMLVKVLTGASSSQPGSVAEANGTSSLAITPEHTGSWVYGITHISPSDTAGPNSSTTYQEQDTTNFNDLGPIDVFYFRSSNVTVDGTPVTLGDVAGAAGNGIILVEIVPSSTLVENSSAPAYVVSTSATSITTAAFSPPTGSLLVAMLATTYPVNGITDTSGLGLTWVLQESLGTFAIYTAIIPSGTSVNTAGVGAQISDVGGVGTTLGGTGKNTAGIGAQISDAGGVGIPGLYTTLSYASSYDTGSSGTGSWVNPSNAEGSPDGNAATWTAP